MGSRNSHHGKWGLMCLCYWILGFRS